MRPPRSPPGTALDNQQCATRLRRADETRCDVTARRGAFVETYRRCASPAQVRGLVTVLVRRCPPASPVREEHCCWPLRVLFSGGWIGKGKTGVKYIHGLTWAKYGPWTICTTWPTSSKVCPSLYHSSCCVEGEKQGPLTLLMWVVWRSAWFYYAVIIWLMLLALVKNLSTNLYTKPPIFCLYVLCLSDPRLCQLCTLKARAVSLWWKIKQKRVLLTHVYAFISILLSHKSMKELEINISSLSK